jgi:peptide/nickel transport system permease protein
MSDKNSPNHKAWLRFKRNKVAVCGLIVIIATFFMAVFAYQIAPDHTPDANEQTLPLEMSPPMTKMMFLLFYKPSQHPIEHHYLRHFFFGTPSPYEPMPIVSHRIKFDFIYVKEYKGKSIPPEEKKFYYTDIFCIDSAFDRYHIKRSVSEIKADPSASVDFENNLRNMIYKMYMPTKTFWLGTDRFGRDILSRLIVGSRVSLFVGLVSVLISLFIGIIAGALAGYFRGRVDAVILWIINVFWSIPTILLAMGLYVGAGTLIESKLLLIFIAVGLTMWVEVARIVRGQFILVREFEYVTAAQSLGYNNMRTIFRHILPNILGPVIVVACANFANAILIESGLSYIGLGVQPPTPSWGGMLSEYKNFIDSDKAFLALSPGFAIMILVLAFNLVGNGLRDALDVRGKPE